MEKHHGNQESPDGAKSIGQIACDKIASRKGHLPGQKYESGVASESLQHVGAQCGEIGAMTQKIQEVQQGVDQVSLPGSMPAAFWHLYIFSIILF